MTPQQVEIAEHLETSLAKAIAACEHDRLFILTDETTRELCWPVVSGYSCLQGAEVISIGATDTHKTLDSLAHVWEELGRLGGTRHTLLINIGGGMVTDLGGFAASTFKRGIQYINIPTTLLAMVDASVGGKTGINFRGLKNEIGVFNNAATVILSTQFLRTLDRENILSGYAEMLKHGLISNEAMWAELMNFPLGAEPLDLTTLQRMLADSVAVKQRIVTEDPLEHGIRKALNLGHTVGHAFESFALNHTPILHGYAVAVGLVCELYLSTIKTGFPTDKMRQTVSFIHEHYGRMPITCDDYPILFELMTHDKKNTAGSINFTLLGGIGDIRINQTATKEEIYEALDFYREG
ncbi:MAG: 3-dehydroquinate synthase [Bacteroidales bacterium]|nr:3-dehydroquinate synthase [Bacteroidales bacterium]